MEHANIFALIKQITEIDWVMWVELNILLYCDDLILFSFLTMPIVKGVYFLLFFPFLLVSHVF